MNPELGQRDQGLDGRSHRVGPVEGGGGSPQARGHLGSPDCRLDRSVDLLQGANGSQGQTLFLGEGDGARLAGQGVDHGQEMPAE